MPCGHRPCGKVSVFQGHHCMSFAGRRWVLTDTFESQTLLCVKSSALPRKCTVKAISTLHCLTLSHFLYQRNSGFSLEAVTGVWRGGLLALWPQKAEWSGSSWWVLKHKKHLHCLLPSGLWAGVAMFLPGCKNQIGLCSTQVQLWHQTVPAFHPPRKLQPHLIERVR